MSVCQSVPEAAYGNGLCVSVSVCQSVPEAAYGHGLCVSVSVCRRVSVSVLCT